MPITSYSTTRDSNASIAPGDLRSSDYRRDQQIINAIRQLMADLAAISAATASLDRLRISNNTDVTTITQTDQPVQIGTYDQVNMMIDGNEIQVRLNGATNTMNLQLLGGNVNVGDVDSILILNGGKIRFPVSQQASTNANELDDYEEGTWTPTITFAGGNGDLNVVYSTQIGRYVKVGRFVVATVALQTSTFTFTTATGELRIPTLPFNSVTTHQQTGTVEHGAGMAYPGGRTMATLNLGANITYLRIILQGSGLGRTAMQASDMTSGSTIVIFGTIVYEVA